MKMKIPESADKIAYYYWFILQKIRKELELQGKNTSTIPYNVVLHPALNDPTKPNSTEEQLLLKKMMEAGIVKCVGDKKPYQVGGDKFSNPDSAGFIYDLLVNEIPFKKMFKNYKTKINQHSIAAEMGDTLVFNVNGEVSYISPEGVVYKTETNLATNKNAYKLLNYLVNQETRKIHPVSVLKDCLNEPRANDDGSVDNERRVRDTIQEIRKSLSYKGDGIFISGGGFGIGCTVRIVK